VIELNPSNPVSSTITPVVDFAPLKTFSEWVWVPGLSWSPDGRFIAAVVHGPPLAAEPAEESQVFDLWLFDVTNGISARIVQQVGMWANPAWGETGVAFGQAVNPLQSATSRYFIDLIDRDGSNRRQLFPIQAELGMQLPELIWSAQNNELLFNYNGNLYILNTQGGPPRQLTTDGQASHLRWVAAAPLETRISGAAGLTATATLTPTATMTLTKSTIATPTPRQEGTEVTITPSVTRTPTLPIQGVPTINVTATTMLTSPVNLGQETRDE
jgi:hypothetical protein